MFPTEYLPCASAVQVACNVLMDDVSASACGRQRGFCYWQRWLQKFVCACSGQSYHAPTESELALPEMMTRSWHFISGLNKTLQHASQTICLIICIGKKSAKATNLMAT